MKAWLLFAICMQFARATELTLLSPSESGAAPTINGIPFDINKPYLQPNAGSTLMPHHPEDTAIQARNISAALLESDAWATNPQLATKLFAYAETNKIAYVLSKAREHKLPAAVAVVPLVESNYNDHAISVKGAAGAWQIMAYTAQDYGFEAPRLFNFADSTQLALQILDDLHRSFGNWALAFAAYNCGKNCVAKALLQNPQAQTIDELAVPQATKDYVHQIVTINQILLRN